MAVEIIPDLERLLANKESVKRAVKSEAKDRERIARGLLQEARTSTPWVKIADPDNLTYTSDQGDPDSRPDWFFSLNAKKPGNPKSIEYGHNPSGVFGPGGRYGHIPSKAPEGLYILHRAAGLM